MILALGKLEWRTLRRRLCAGVTLLAYLIAAIGFPAPQTSAQTTSSCGQQVCCCGSAAQCKASGCGCPHGGEAEPPKEEEAGSCCVKKKQETSVTPKAPSKPKGSTVRWVIGMSALKCKEGATHWVSADVALPSPAPVTWQPSWPYSHTFTITHEHPFGIAEDLLDPPPRLEAI
jgi:hypothetical protein